MVSEVWAGLRESTEASTRPTRRQMALGRGLFNHQWEAPLSLARGGSGRYCPRHLGANPTQQKGGEEVFPQVAEGLAVRAAGHHYGQVEELRCGEAGDSPRGRASPESVSQAPQ